MKRKKQMPAEKNSLGFRHVRTVKDISEFACTKNDLRVLHLHIPGSGAVTTNIVYLVGSRHEARGETGIDQHARVLGDEQRRVARTAAAENAEAHGFLLRKNPYFIFRPGRKTRLGTREERRDGGMVTSMGSYHACAPFVASLQPGNPRRGPDTGQPICPRGVPAGP